MTKTRIALAAATAALLLGSAAPSHAGGYGYGYGPSGYSTGYVPYRKKRSNVGAIVAGTLGALALGTVATQGFAAAPAAYPPLPDYGSYGAGYAPSYPACTVIQRRVVDPYGMVQVVRERVCN